MTRLGYQINNFSYPDSTTRDLFQIVQRQAIAADNSGFDTFLVMDHLNQLPMLGPPDNEMLECYTVLAAVAAVTNNMRLGALVTSNTYRNPAFLAKVVSTLDIVSGGRAQLGIGAGWFEHEHDGFGYDFNTFTERFEKLEEALQIILPMLRGERPTVDGKYYRTVQAINEPQPINPVPIMIGGTGEKKTLRMVAQYGDLANFTCEVHEVEHKLDVLQQHCDNIGRDRSEITVSLMQNVVIAATYEQARDEYFASLQRTLGIDAVNASADEQAFFEAQLVLGDPDTVGEKLAAALATGVDGLTTSLPVNGYIEGRVEMLGSIATPLIN